VAVWFLVESYYGEDIDAEKRYLNNYIYGIAPRVRILKRREKLSEQVRLISEQYSEYDELLEKAKRAYRDGLGAGSIVYLRKIFEQIVEKAANTAKISCLTNKGHRKSFKALLKEVEEECSIIPKEFSENGYRLFGELSDVVHGEYDEDLGLLKFEALHRLIIGILENSKNHKELIAATCSLGWHT
jgi:hypothetical protein